MTILDSETVPPTGGTIPPATTEVESETMTEAPEPRTFVTFELSGQCLSMDVTRVRKILDRCDVNPVPNAPSDVVGVIDVRGDSVVVIDLCSRLGRPPIANKTDMRFLVVEVGDPTTETCVAVGVDKVLEVAQIADAQIEAPPRGAGGASDGTIFGVTRSNGKLVMLIDSDKVLDLGTDGGSALGSGLFDFGNHP